MFPDRRFPELVSYAKWTLAPDLFELDQRLIFNGTIILQNYEEKKKYYLLKVNNKVEQ